jgi:WD40 repeat protein
LITQKHHCFFLLAKIGVFVVAIDFSLADTSEKITYDDHVSPIFQQTCLNCHNPDKVKGGLDLSSFTGVMKGGSGGNVTESGDVSSKLLTCLSGSGDQRMPPEGDAISGDKIAMIKKWIEGGLLESSKSAARKPSKPKFDSSMSVNPLTKPDGSPPMPQDLLLDPPIVTSRGSAITAMAASPWAPLLAVTSQRQILLYNTEALELVGVLPFPEGAPRSLNFTPDGRYLIVGGGIAGKLGVTVTFDVVNGQRILTAAKEFDEILATDIKPSFDIIVSGSPSRLLKFWNTQTNQQVKSIKKHTDWITSLDISPDGILVASGDRNGGLYVWEVDTGSEFQSLRAHQATITCASFRQDSNILASSSEDGTVRFWEMNGGTEVKKIDAHAAGVRGFCWAKDGSFVTVGRDQIAKLWKTDFSYVLDFEKIPTLPTAIAFNAEGTKVFVSDVDGNIHVFNTTSPSKIAELNNYPCSIANRIQALKLTIDASTPEQQSELYKRHNFWNAAAVNAKLIHGNEIAVQQMNQFDEMTEKFISTNKEYALIAEQANIRREKLKQIQRDYESYLKGEEVDSDAIIELEAVRKMMKIRFDDAIAISRDKIKELTALQLAIEEQSSSRISNKYETQKLAKDYLALKELAK